VNGGLIKALLYPVAPSLSLSPFFKVFHPVNWLIALDRISYRLESFLLATTLITMLSFASLQVILRNFFDTGIEWGDVFARHLVLWVGFFGATLATKESRHIRIDALLKVFSKRWLPLVELFVHAFCIVVGALLCNSAYKFMMDERMAETVLFLDIPTWYFMSIMPAGFAIITFRYFIQLVEMLFKFGGKTFELQEGSENNAIDINVNIKLK